MTRHLLCVVDGANINDVLLRGIEFLIRQEEIDHLATRVSMLLLITDSNPTIGLSDSTRVLSGVRQASGARVLINVFRLSAGVGNTNFLERLARQNRGSLRTCCGSRSDGSGGPASELKDFYREMSRPLLENVRFRYEDEVDDTTLTTVDYPAYFEGCELVVVGRLRSGVTHFSVKVSGGSKQV